MAADPKILDTGRKPAQRSATARRLGAASRALSKDPLLVTIAVATILILLWFPATSVGTVTRLRVYWAVQPLLDLVFIWSAVRLMRSAGLDRAGLRFWRGTTTGISVIAVGDSAQTLIAIFDPGRAAGSLVQLVCACGGMAIIVVTMLTHPVEQRGRSRLRAWLDTLATMAGVATATWFFSIPSQATVEDLAWPLAISGLTMLAAYGIGRLTYGGHPPFRAGAGIASVTVAIMMATAATLPIYDQPGLFGVKLLPSLLCACIPRIQMVQMRTDPHALERGRRRPYSAVPYVVLAISSALLVIALTGEGQSIRLRVWGVLAGTLIGAALVVMRQLVMFGDNALLLERLDASMLQLSRHERRFRSLVQYASDVTLILGDGTVRYAGSAVHQVLGVAPEDVLGLPVARLVHPDDMTRLSTVLGAPSGSPGEVLALQIRMLHRDGSWRWLDAVLTDLRAEPSVEGFVLNGHDVTETRRLHDRLRHQAHHDGLTGLANRAFFDAEVAAARERHERDPAWGPISVLLLDLDGFKAVNDTLGHHAGDAMLIAVAARLATCMRNEDAVARLGGDEFAALLPLMNRAEAPALVRRVRKALEPPVLVDGRPVPIRASIGVATGSPADTVRILREADTAMYAAKARSRSGHARRAAVE